MLCRPRALPAPVSSTGRKRWIVFMLPRRKWAPKTRSTARVPVVRIRACAPPPSCALTLALGLLGERLTGLALAQQAAVVRCVCVGGWRVVCERLAGARETPKRPSKIGDVKAVGEIRAPPAPLPRPPSPPLPPSLTRRRGTDGQQRDQRKSGGLHGWWLCVFFCLGSAFVRFECVASTSTAPSFTLPHPSSSPRFVL